MQTVYIGNTLVNDVFLGSQRIDDVLTPLPLEYALPPVTNGLQLYLTTYASQSYNSGSTTWADLSGNARNFNLVNPSYYVSGSYNGLLLGGNTGANRTATRIFSSSLDFTFNTTGSAFVVFKKHPNYSAENFAAWLSINNNTTTNNDFTNYQRHGFSNAGSPAFSYVYTNGAASLYTDVENVVDDTDFHLQYEGWTTGTGNAYISTDTNSTGSASGTTMATFNNSGSLRMSIGQNARLSLPNGTDSANSVFYEIALYSRKLQGQELEDVKNYFINRYGIV